MKQSTSSSSIIVGLLVSGVVVIVTPWQCASSFTATVMRNTKSQQQQRQQLHSSPSFNNFLDEYNNQQQGQYFNSPSYPSHELRWALKVQVGIDERNVISLLNDELLDQTTTTTSQAAVTAASSTPVVESSSTTTTSTPRQSKGRPVVRAIESAQQAYRENREVEAYNLLNPLEKQQRKMDGPQRSRLEMVQPLSSVRRMPSQENFVFQYADADSAEFTKTVDDIVQGTLIEDVLVRTAAEFGKQSASLLGGNDPENWID